MKVNCPHCRAVTTWHGNPNRPFCSERCRLIDLGAWVNEEYRIPVSERPLEDDSDVDALPPSLP